MPPPFLPGPAGNVVGFPPGAPPPMPPPRGAAPPLPLPPPGPGGAPGGPPQPNPGAGPAPPGQVGGMAGPPAPPAGMMGAPPGMIINPAFIQWQQLSQAWHAEQQRREDEFLSACMTIRADVSDGYKIDIEADSTIAPDEQEEKAARTEFLQSIVPLLQLLIPEAQQNPGAVPLVRALVMFGVRSFPAARSLEEQFEQAFRQLFQSPAPPPDQKGGNVKSPAEIQSEQQIAAGKAQVDQQGNQVKAAQVQVQQQANAIKLYQAMLASQNEQRAQSQDAMLRSAELSQQQQENEDRKALEQARLTHLLTRSTPGLV